MPTLRMTKASSSTKPRPFLDEQEISFTKLIALALTEQTQISPQPTPERRKLLSHREFLEYLALSLLKVFCFVLIQLQSHTSFLKWIEEV